MILLPLHQGVARTCIFDERGQLVADCCVGSRPLEECEELARLIVEAVNSHMPALTNEKQMELLGDVRDALL